MLTLTISQNVGESPLDRRIMLHRAWSLLRKRMMRRLKVKVIPYMAFVEKTEKGEPHLHILLRCGYIHYKWYSRQMKDIVKSPIIWIEKIKNAKRAAYYVSKYCTKAPAQFGSMKRYWRARTFVQDSDEKKIKRIWRRDYTGKIRERYRETVQTRLNRGWALKQLTTGWIDFIRPGQIPPTPGYVFYSYASSDLQITRIDNIST
jgi:hypothetical protein